MAKVAHITSKPGVEVGDRALALCGKDFKVKVLWTDVPTEKPICRECVDVALDAMTEADALLGRARVDGMLIEARVERLTQTLNPPDLFLDVIAENESEYAAARASKQEAKDEAKRAKTTCTCTWGTIDDDDEKVPVIDEVDPDCPIHGEPEPEPENGDGKDEEDRG